MYLRMDFVKKWNKHKRHFLFDTLSGYCWQMKNVYIQGSWSRGGGVGMWLPLAPHFSIECHKTKTKAITLANHNRVNNTISQSE